jgi:hypothetical protein
LKLSKEYFHPQVKLILYRIHLVEVHEDYSHEELRFASGQKIQLDIYLPKESLAFEYQGEQHYYEVHPFTSPQWKYSQRDEEKRIICRTKGITLVEVRIMISI